MKYSVLVVEDDSFTQEFYRYFFSRSGYLINITEDIDELFRRLDNEKIDVVILDINLKNSFYKEKKIDGLQIAEIIKKNEKYKNIPILIITAFQNKFGKTQTASYDIADDYIIKPINDFNELIQKVEKLIKNGRERQNITS